MSASRKIVVDLRSKSVAFAIPDRVSQAIIAAAPGDWRVHVVQAVTDSFADGSQQPSEESVQAIADAEVYVGFGMPKPLFTAAKKLKWVQSGSAGVATLLFDEMKASDVLLTNAAGLYGPTIAEYTLAGVLHFIRGFDVAFRDRAVKHWDPNVFASERVLPRELSELTVLVVGAGGIGTEIATRFTALGSRVLGIRRRPALGTPAGFESVYGFDALDRLLPEADVIVLATPLTPETKGLLSAERIARLNAGAIVVNIARGKLADEDALYRALAEGRIRGAVLDVFGQEPLASDSPVWHLERVLYTPHVSGVAPTRFWDRLRDLILDNWARYRAGDPMRNVVDKRAGY